MYLGNTSRNLSRIHFCRTSEALFILINFYWRIVAFNVVLYNVLASSIQQGKSAIDIHISSFFKFLFYLSYHRALNRVP